MEDKIRLIKNEFFGLPRNDNEASFLSHSSSIHGRNIFVLLKIRINCPMSSKLMQIELNNREWPFLRLFDCFRLPTITVIVRYIVITVDVVSLWK